MNFSIKAQLLGLLSALGLILLGTNGLNLMAQTSAEASLNTIYADRVVPLKDLKLISDEYAVFIVDATHKIRSGAFSWDEGEAAISNAAAKIATVWQAYTSTYLVPEEVALVEQARPLMEDANSAIADVLAIIRAKDRAALDHFVNNALYPKIDPITEVIGKLIELQVRVVEAEHASASSAFSVNQWLAIALFALALAGIGVGAWVVSRRVVKPLHDMKDAMDQLAKGQWQTKVPGLERTDEIGGMAKSVAVFRDNGVENERLTAERQKQQENERRRAETLSETVANFNASMDEAVKTIAVASAELQATAQVLTQNADQTMHRSSAVAAASEEASTNVQTVASASEEMSSSVSEISQQVSASAKAATRAVAAADSANQQVKGLVAAAQKIGEVVRLISDIAGQTNLLALNATIEAARAGEAGRGFAVVATEVKALADQTAKATDDIGRSISEIQSVITRSADSIGEIGILIGEISTMSDAIAAAVEEQGAATREIARNVQQAAGGTREVASNIVGVSQSVQEISSAATQVLGAAGDLSRQSEAIRTQMDRFVTKVRAI